MPIHKMNLDDGVFFAKQVGYIDHVDARMWANALKNHARNSDIPIMAVVDMTEVDRLCPTAIKEFSASLQAGNVLGVLLVTGDSMASRNARVLSKLDELNGVRVFPTLDEARRFASTRVRPTVGAYVARSVMSYAAIPAF